MNREQQKQKLEDDTDQNEVFEIKLGKRTQDNIVYESKPNGTVNGGEPSNTNNLEKLVRGINTYKRLFYGSN